MTNRSLLLLLVAVSACDEKKPAPPMAVPAAETKPAEPKPAKPAEAKPAEAKPAEAEAKPTSDLKEIDLSVWGPAWKGYVAMAPAGAKATFDDPSRQLTVSET
jgi:pyruvate/2-oxoglutarate dehydrogenase complex dihydrolipoamide acyltransferase (E2) component